MFIPQNFLTRIEGLRIDSIDLRQTALMVRNDELNQEIASVVRLLRLESNRFLVIPSCLPSECFQQGQKACHPSNNVIEPLTSLVYQQSLIISIIKSNRIPTLDSANLLSSGKFLNATCCNFFTFA